MSRNENQIAVVGAGIAGLATAVALARRGVSCQVYEQTGRLGEVGAGLQLSPNSVRLLHRWGLADRLAATAVRAEAVEMRRWSDDRVLRRSQLGAHSEELFGAPYYAVHRADLHRALLELLPPGTLRLGARCVDVREDAEGAELTFEDGTRRRAGVVVGADGIHSAVRARLVADTPRNSGESIYRGLVPAERVPFAFAAHNPAGDGPEPKVVLWLGPGQHVVCYPVSAGAWVSFAATAPAGDWHTESWTAEGSVTDLVDAYAGWHPHARDLLAAADRVTRWALHDRDPVTRWTSERLALVGDAAHPMLPFFAQGANQAVEDAASLAVCLAAAGPDGLAEPRRTLEHYQRVRLERTGEIQTISRRNTAMLHLPDGPDQRERDQHLAETADPRGQDWLYGYDAEEAARAPRVAA